MEYLQFEKSLFSQKKMSHLSLIRQRLKSYPFFTDRGQGDRWTGDRRTGGQGTNVLNRHVKFLFLVPLRHNENYTDCQGQGTLYIYAYYILYTAGGM